MASVAELNRARNSEVRARIIAGLVLTFVLTAFPLAMQMAAAQTYDVVHKLMYSEGGFSEAGLIQDEMGTFYGTTILGGTSNNGTLFKVNPKGRVTVLYSFTGGTDGAWPASGVVRDAAGNLYGTTVTGGNPRCMYSYDRPGCGTVFKLSAAGEFSVLHSFSGKPWDGFSPDSGGSLLLDGKGNLFGTTAVGGRYNSGTVFKISQTGKFSLVYSFGKRTGDAFVPNSGLLLMGGNLYGTSVFGGAFDNGTVFRVGSHGKETVLYSFKNHSDGGRPNAPLVSDAAGNLYGTTAVGGGHCGGTVFKLSTSGKISRIHCFTLAPADGEQPAAGLTWDAAGNLYGTTWGGGTGCKYGCGTIFKLTPTHPGWTESIIHSFDWESGAKPLSVLLVDSTGSLYGTTSVGGISKCESGQGPGCGVVYKLTP